MLDLSLKLVFSLYLIGKAKALLKVYLFLLSTRLIFLSLL